MTEFVTGIFLGSVTVFFIMEYQKWKSCFIKNIESKDKTTENTQWHNLMNYNGSERGQINFENCN